jgi:hypothetical protein
MSATIPVTREVMTVRAALAYLPDSCRFHGDEIEGRDNWAYAGACCGTGEPALAKRRALAALESLWDRGRSAAVSSSGTETQP